jgi:hypothetical protein
MADPWRIEYEGALDLVFSRGNNQQNIFVTDRKFILVLSNRRSCADLLLEDSYLLIPHAFYSGFSFALDRFN